MTTDEKNKFKRLAAIQAKKDALEDEEKELRAVCLAIIQKAGVDRVEADYGVFSVMKRKTWAYSTAVADAQQEIFELKKSEEESGAATCTTSESLRYQAKKAEINQ